jgi:tetratricopeptide (TPR) repeat protein
LSLGTRLLIVALAGTSCAAAGTRPSADRDAIREATRPDAPGRTASSGAFAHYLRARRAELDGDFRLAAEELQQALAHDPQSPQLRLALAEVLARMAQLPRAEVEARRALEADPKGSSAAEAHLLLGKLAALQQQRERAVAELRAAIAVQIAGAQGKTGDAAVLDPEPWRLLGEIQLEAGEEEAASRTFEELAARVPGEGGGFREMGRHFLEKKDLERAERYLRKAVEKDPGDVEAWRKLAQLEEGRRRPDAARKDYEALLRHDPDDGDALLALGRISLRAGDLGAARAWFGQLFLAARDEGGARLGAAFAWLDARRPADALQVAEEGLAATPTDGRLRYAKGLALQDLKRWAEAAEAFAAVLPEEGELYASARASLAYSLSHAGRHGEAAKALEPALAQKPRDVRLVTMKAYVLDRAGRSADAVALLERAVKEREGEPGGGAAAELTEALAASLQRAGRVADSIAVLKRALAAQPEDESLGYALGVALEKAGDRDAAVAAMQELLLRSPEHADALNFVGYSFAERGMRLDEAEKLVEKAIQLRPDSGYFTDSLGWVYFQKGDFGRAVTTLEKADALSGPEPTILEHLGDAYRRAQRPADAAGAYRRALKGLDAGAEPERPDQRAGIEKKLRDLPGGELRPAKR